MIVTKRSEVIGSKWIQVSNSGPKALSASLEEVAEIEMKNKEKKIAKNLFSLDGRLVKTLTRLTDIIILNTLFIVCCLPILTIGASLTALATMWHRLLKGEDTDLVFHFFRLFRANFKQATVIWLTCLDYLPSLSGLLSFFKYGFL